jgi:site-specific recombinase XerD
MSKRSATREQALFVVSKLPLELDVRASLTDCQARNLSPNTIRICRNNLVAFQEWLYGVSQVAAATPHHIRRFLVDLQETHNAGGVRQDYRVLKTFFRWLLAEMRGKEPQQLDEKRHRPVE